MNPNRVPPANPDNNIYPIIYILFYKTLFKNSFNVS